MIAIAGFDVGFSPTRTTCGIAVRDLSLVGRTVKRYGDVRAGAFRLADTRQVLSDLLSKAGGELVVVVDAPISADGPPKADRSVDSLCSRKGFYRRAQSYPVTQNTGNRLVEAIYSVLNTLGTPYEVWTGLGPRPRGFVVIETNPTTAMALTAPQQNPEHLPSRSRALNIGGQRVRAKSDWYWRTSARNVAASALNAPSIADETHHERVAALFCLSLAAQVTESAADHSLSVALGDARTGVYLVPARIDASWKADIERVGVAYGEPSYHIGTLSEPTTTALDVVPLAGESADHLDERSLEAGDIVDLVLTDTGGIARTANPWLDGVDGECTAKLCGAQGVTIEFARFAGPNGAFQSTIKPSALELAKRIGGDRVTLCKDRPVRFTIEIVDRRDEASSR